MTARRWRDIAVNTEEVAAGCRSSAVSWKMAPASLGRQPAHVVVVDVRVEAASAFRDHLTDAVYAEDAQALACTGAHHERRAQSFHRPSPVSPSLAAGSPIISIIVSRRSRRRYQGCWSRRPLFPRRFDVDMVEPTEKLAMILTSAAVAGRRRPRSVRCDRAGWPGPGSSDQLVLRVEPVVRVEPGVVVAAQTVLDLRQLSAGHQTTGFTLMAGCSCQKRLQAV